MATFVRTQEVEHEIGRTGAFALRVASSDVELHGTDEPVARARITFDIRAASDEDADAIFERAQFEVEVPGGELRLAEPRRSSSGVGSLARFLGFTGGEVSASVEVQLPAAASVRVEGVSADATAIGLRGVQEYRTVSGDLVLDGVSGDVRLRSVSGDVSLRADGPLGSFEANTVSGDLSAVAPSIGQLRIVTVSGDVELEAQLSEGPRHQIETVSGDLSLGVVGDTAVEVRGLSTDVSVSLPHRSEGSRDRRRYVIGSGRADVLFSSMSGDAIIGPARRLAPAAPPPPPRPPEPPRPPMSPEAQLEVLQALERGEIDVDEAARRLVGAPDA